MEIRIVEDSDMQDAYYLSSQAFRRGERDDNYAVNRLKDANRTVTTTFGVYDSAGLQAKVVVIQYQQIFSTQFVAPMGGIGGVACLPASRGKGYAGVCLKHSLQYMRETGQYLSTLYPFAWEFYRRLGWEWVGNQRVYSIPTRLMTAIPETESVRQALKDDRAAIAAIYSEYASRYRGMALRDDRMWNRLLDDEGGRYSYTYLYESTTGAEGYVTFQLGGKDSTHIEEFIATTPRAQRALLGLLKRHEMQVSTFKWSAPNNDMLWSNLYHGDIETRIEPVVQARIVDVVPALSALKPPPEVSGEVVLSIKDETAPWNIGGFRVTVQSGHVQVTPAAAEPGVALDIQALTQAYYGVPDLDAVRSAGRLRVHNEVGYQLLNSLLAGPTMWLNDHF